MINCLKSLFTSHNLPTSSPQRGKWKVVKPTSRLYQAQMEWDTVSIYTAPKHRVLAFENIIKQGSVNLFRMNRHLEYNHIGFMTNIRRADGGGLTGDVTLFNVPRALLFWIVPIPIINVVVGGYGGLFSDRPIMVVEI